jgi:hypothetical protein
MHRIMIVTALAIVYNANLCAQNQGARQRIWECYYSHGATNIGLMAACSGYYVTESALGSCLNGFYCSPPLAVPVPPQPPEPPTQRPQRGGTTVPTTPNSPPFDFRLGPGSTPPQPPETPTQRPQRGGTTVRTRPTPPPIDFRLGACPRILKH